MVIETRQDHAVALERMRRRDPEVMAQFILTLAQNSGPVGEQVRTFIVGDNVVEVVNSVSERIKGSEIPDEYAHRHVRGREMGEHLAFIVESIERLVLPVNPKAAFELLVAVFEADSLAMENCGEHDWEVECAYRRAAEVMVEAAKSLPASDVAETITALLATDSYGVRRALSQVLDAAIGRS